MTPQKDRRERPNQRAGRRAWLRPRHFKFMLAFNIALVAITGLARPEWLEWSIALALTLTIVEIVVIALAQD